MATLYHQVWIDAPIDKVYAALASAEGLSEWWVPHTSTKTPEGLVLAHSPGAAHGEVRMKVMEATPHKHIAWEVISTHPPESPASAWTGTHIIFRLAERSSPGHWLGMDDDGRTLTVLDFRQVGWDENSPYLGFCNFAWGTTLILLQQWCEGGTEVTLPT